MNREKMISLLEVCRYHLTAKIDDVTTGIEEGIYDDDSDNRLLLTTLNQQVEDIDAAIADLKKPLPDVGIVLEGGVVQHAFSNDPAALTAAINSLFLIDHDVDGEERNDLNQVGDEWASVCDLMIGPESYKGEIKEILDGVEAQEECQEEGWKYDDEAGWFVNHDKETTSDAETWTELKAEIDAASSLAERADDFMKETGITQIDS